jgi:hypothetical protein
MKKIKDALLSGCLCVCAVPANAGGSVSLDDVLEAIKDVPALVGEIRAELAKSDLQPGDVICSGDRHGNRWTYLGGARAAPYECEIGKRELIVEAERTYFDGRGKSLGSYDKANPKQARHFKETNFSWKWSP